MKPVLMIRWSMVCLVAAVSFIACNKSTNGTTKVLVTNATVTTGDLSVAWGGVTLTPVALAQGKTSGTSDVPYRALPAGTHELVLKSGNNVLLDKNIYGGALQHYSMLAYDSSKTSTRPIIVFLTDDLTAVDSVNHAKFRFIYCAPDTLVLDILLVNSKDTIGIGAQGFIGVDAAAANYQAFTTVKRGTYKFYAFITGTAFRSKPVLTTDSIVFGSRGIYSLVYSGNRGSTAADSLKLATIQHPAD